MEFALPAVINASAEIAKAQDELAAMLSSFTSAEASHTHALVVAGQKNDLARSDLPFALILYGT